MRSPCFFFNDTATTEIYTLSLHDALPISLLAETSVPWYRLLYVYSAGHTERLVELVARSLRDRKSTRLNSSHSQISYAVLCLKKKNTTQGLTYAYSDTTTPVFLSIQVPVS